MNAEKAEILRLQKQIKTYVLYAETSDKIYIGFTADVQKRLAISVHQKINPE